MKNLGLYLVLGGVAVAAVVLLTRPNILGGGAAGGSMSLGGMNMSGGVAGGGEVSPNSPVAPPSDTEVDASGIDAMPMTPLERYQEEEIAKIKAGCCICEATRKGDVKCVNTVTGRRKTYRNTQNVSRVRAKCNKQCDDGDGPSDTIFGDDKVSGIYKQAMTKGMINPSSMFATHKLHYF